MRHAGYILFLCLTLSGMMCGCWNRQEPERLSIITAIAFDYDEGKDQYIITLQVARPALLGAPEEPGGQGESVPFYAPALQGDAPYQVLRSFEAEFVREAFWAETEAILIGEALARRGVRPVLDLLERERQFRLTAKAYVVKGQAGPILEQPFAYQTLTGIALRRMVETGAGALSMTPQGTLLDRSMELARPGWEMFMPRLLPREVDELTIPNPVRLEGGGVFRDDRMVGWFDGRATRGWYLISGKFGRSNLIMDLGEGPGKVAVELIRYQGQLSLEWEDDMPRFVVEVRLSGRVQGQTGAEGISVPSPLLAELEDKLGKEMEEDIAQAVLLAQQLQSDIMGFGEMVYRKHPHRWTQLEERWYSQVFPALEVKAEVRVEIDRSGMIVEPTVRRK